MKKYSDYSDSELTREIKASNRDAFQALYWRFYDPLYRYLWYRIHSMELAADFIQEVFTRIWENRKKLDYRQSIKAYLYRIAHNLIYDHTKKTAREMAYLAELTIEESASFENFSNLELDILAAIEKFPAPVREVFCLSRFEGLKYAEIADVYGVSVKTIEHRISQALQMLYENLE